MRFVALSTIVATTICGGCGTLPILPAAQVASDPALATTKPTLGTTIAGNVATASPDTGLPQTLSGTLSEQFEGTYDENILEVFFDDTGAPIASVSRSIFTIDSPDTGTITSLNFIVVLGPELMTGADGNLILDEAGNPIPIGLRTASSGQIIHGTGDFEGTIGELHSDSTVLFGGGSMDLGTLLSNVVFSLEPTRPLTTLALP